MLTQGEAFKYNQSDLQEILQIQVKEEEDDEDKVYSIKTLSKYLISENTLKSRIKFNGDIVRKTLQNLTPEYQCEQYPPQNQSCFIDPPIQNANLANHYDAVDQNNNYMQSYNYENYNYSNYNYSNEYYYDQNTLENNYTYDPNLYLEDSNNSHSNYYNTEYNGEQYNCYNYNELLPENNFEVSTGQKTDQLQNDSSLSNPKYLTYYGDDYNGYNEEKFSTACTSNSEYIG